MTDHEITPEPAAGGAASTPSLTRGSILFFLAQVIGNAAYFLTVLILARGLGPANRGVLAFIIVCALITPRVADLGVVNATGLYAAQEPRRRPVIFGNAMTWAIVSALAGALVICGALELLKDHRPAGIGPADLAAIAVAIVALAVQEECFFYLQGCGWFRERALVSAAGPWGYAILLIVVWVVSGLTVTNAAVSWAAGQSLMALAVTVYCLRIAGIARPDFVLWRKMLHFGTRAWVGTMARFLNFRVDQLLMGFIATEAALGIYAVAVNASEILLYLPSAIGLVLTPVIARSGAAERVETTLRTFRILTAITTVSLIVAAILGPFLIPIAFGSAYDGAVVPFLWLLPGALGYAAMTAFSSAAIASEAPGRSSVGPFAALLVGVALDLILIPPLGADGAAIAASGAFLSGGLVALLAYKAIHPFGLRALIPTRADVSRFGSVARAATDKTFGHASESA
jgi:O-antigen/teichoic acid export membrane protein